MRPLDQNRRPGRCQRGLARRVATLGVDARILLPGYRQVLALLPDYREVARIAPMADFPGSRLLQGRMASGVPLYALDCPELYQRPGGPYQDEAGSD